MQRGDGMAIRMRTGNEEKFDAGKMVPGEWAVSTDTKYVRMCFAPGVVARMATYEAFEADMVQIQTILATCQDIQEAVEAFAELAEQHAAQAATYSVESKSWAVGGTALRTGEDTDNAKYYAQQAETSASNAETSAQRAIISEQSAADSALSAKDSAASADLNAGIASSKAADAKTLAETASVKAVEALDSATSASTFATEARNSALVSAENAQNASNDADRAEAAAQQAESIANIGIATIEIAGIVKPDGTSVIVDEDGTLHSQGGSAGTIDYNELENKPFIDGVELQGNKSLDDLGIQPKGEYALTVNAGHSLSLSIDPATYIMTLSLLNEAGGILSTKTIDFPLESMVINAEYSLGVLTLALQNGQTVDVDISDIVSGLVKDTFTIAGIDMKNNITADELRTALGVQNIPNVSTNDQTPTFEQAATRENIASGEKLSVIFGKIMKWFSDLKSVAFSGSYNDLSNKPTIPTKTSQLTNDSGFKTTDNNTWKANTASSEGYVAKGSGQANKVWKTDANGNPGWRDDNSSSIVLTNNLLATVAGTALDAVQGKALDGKITTLNNNLANGKVKFQVTSDGKLQYSVFIE